jgi:hypothetical protein
MRYAAMVVLFVTAVTFSGCGGSEDSTGPDGPDFSRELAPGEYQVSVTGAVQRSFESMGATYTELGSPPFVGFERAQLSLMGNQDDLNGAEFNSCAVPVPGATYAFDATTLFAGCPSEPGRVTGGFIVQLGAPQADELDCYGNGYGDKAFEGHLTITAMSSNDIQGTAEGSGTCSRHPHSEIAPMGAANVTVRIRFRAVKEAFSGRRG